MGGCGVSQNGGVGTIGGLVRGDNLGGGDKGGRVWARRGVWDAPAV